MATSIDFPEEPSENAEIIYEPIVEVLVVPWLGREPIETQAEDDSERAAISKIYSLFLNWTSPELPDLLDHWQREDIDFILMSAASDMSEENFRADGAAIIRFLAASGYKDEPPLDEEGRPIERRVTALHLVDEARSIYDEHTDTDRQLFRDLFLIYDRFDVNYVDPRGWSHFRAACEFGFDDLVEKFLVHGRVNPDRGLDPNTRLTHLQTAMYHEHRRVVELLLRHGADPNLRNEAGYTLLHHVAMTLDDHPAKVELLFETCRELGPRRVEVDAPDERWGETAFHQALENGNLKIAESLLGHGADPCLARRLDGQTPLHVICDKLDFEDLQRFSEMRSRGGEAIRARELDARDRLGNTPLHLAAQRPEARLVEPLLGLGAEPNAANELGETPLHRMAASWPDARTIELLLRRGADAEARARDGSTPLHALCRGDHEHDDDRSLETFLRVSEELSDEPVPIDARDGSARTALQLAVASLKPNCVRALLSRGADLASFLFPDEDYFGETFVPSRLEHERPVAHGTATALRLASSALACVEQLESSGRYELDRADLLTIVKFFCVRGLFRVRMRVGLGDDHWREPEFAQRAKACMMTPCLSLYDLTSVGPEAAARLVTHAQFCKFDLAADDWRHDELRATFLAHLFAQMSAGFFRRLRPLLLDPHPLWLDWLAESEFYQLACAEAAREQDKGCRRAIKFL
ncbi:unnamed protein product [Trichogramma brassicae]|uniref:Uncharacterized protein n=1 Tax=Trichogramma brassicae TaxID=86971 RepID=A0A6H5ICK4_9HYME|nr:unnamed protein product [Trichogramma brassicae]